MRLNRTVVFELSSAPHFSLHVERQREESEFGLESLQTHSIQLEWKMQERNNGTNGKACCLLFCYFVAVAISFSSVYVSQPALSCQQKNWARRELMMMLMLEWKHTSGVSICLTYPVPY